MMWDSLQQDYVYPDAKDRQFLHYFYKGVKKQKFSVERYNALKDELASVRCFFLIFFMKDLELAVFIFLVFLISNLSLSSFHALLSYR